MKRGFFSLRRLRWKLTLSYTLVTVVALLMAELLLVAALIAFLSSPVLPGFVVQDLKETVVPRLQPALSETPPAAEALREQLKLLRCRLDPPGRAHLAFLADRDLAEIAVDIKPDRSHLTALLTVDIDVGRAAGRTTTTDTRSRRTRASRRGGQILRTGSQPTI